MKNTDPQTILITGSSGAIGQAVCMTYARKRTRLLILAKECNKLLEIKQSLLEAGSPEVEYFTLDYLKTQPETCVMLAKKIFSRFPSLDGLIHCAGTVGKLTPIEYYPPLAWENTYRVNFTSPMLLTQSMLPLLKRAPNAKIIFTLNDIAKANPAFWGAYGVANAALAQFSDTLKAELAHTNIQIQTIFPKPTRSGLRKSAFPSEDSAALCSAYETAKGYF